MIELVVGAAAALTLIGAAYLGVVNDRQNRRAVKQEEYAEKLTGWEHRLGLYTGQLNVMHDMLEKRVMDDPRYKRYWEEVEDGKGKSGAPGRK